jgi:hypothetical protein
MKVILSNPLTGEKKTVIGNRGQIPKGWKILEIIKDKSAKDVQLAVWASKYNLPLASFLDAARWLLDKDCPFCQLGTQVLRRINELGRERAEKLIEEILVAKQANDTDYLEKLRKQFNG